MNIQELKAKHPERYEREYQKWQEYACYHDWWDSVYEMAKEDGAAKGFDIDDIFFSGFWMQGSGACWEGSIGVEKFIEAHNLKADPQWFLLGEMVRNGVVRPNVGVELRGSRHSHEGNMRSDGIEVYASDSYVFEKGVLTGASMEDFAEQVDFHDLSDDLLEAAKDYAQDIYRMLETEYEYLISEEEFIASCECNEIDFDEEDE